MAETPPADHPQSVFGRWSASNFNWSHLAKGKRNTGWLVGEAPGARHMNYYTREALEWYRVLARTLAPQIAVNNLDYSGFINIGGAQVFNSLHLDYYADADMWFSSAVDASGNVAVSNSTDAETWATVQYPANVSSTGDASKVVSDGTICAVAADDGIDAEVFVSTNNTVANMTGGNFPAGDGLNAVESSDLVYDGTYWIWAGRSTTAARIFTASDPTGSWTSRAVPGAPGTDMISLATDGAGTSVAQGSSGQAYYSTNGITWVAATTSPTAANNIVYSKSLGLFVLCENTTGEMWTSEDGVNWTDMWAAEGVPPLHNLVHTDDFVLGWGKPSVSANGESYFEIYAFHQTALDRDSFSWTRLGTVWSDLHAPKFNTSLGIYSCGGGKLVFPWDSTSPSDDAYLALSHYGAPDAY
jgi:hypothetical protein